MACYPEYSFSSSLWGGGGKSCFSKQKTGWFSWKKQKKYGALYLFDKSPFFFRCEPALGSSLALNKFSFWLDKGCTPTNHKTPPPPQIYWTLWPNYFPQYPCPRGLFYHKKRAQQKCHYGSIKQWHLTNNEPPPLTPPQGLMHEITRNAWCAPRDDEISCRLDKRMYPHKP